MTEEESTVYKMHAENLAYMILTRITDVSVAAPTPSFGLDYLLTIPSQDGLGRLLGVIIRTGSKISEMTTSAGVEDDIVDDVERQEFTRDYPVMLLLCAVDEDEGCVGWLLAPEIQGNEPRLVRPKDIKTEPATRERLQEMARSVISWHEALRAA